MVMLTKAESKFLYWIDWAWDRSEEGLLTIRFYWWCAQFGTAVVVPVLVRCYGWGTAARYVVFIMTPRYVYDERHSWTGTEEEPVSAVELIATLRQEQRDRVAIRNRDWETYHEPVPTKVLSQDWPTLVQQAQVHPLIDRLSDYWENKPPLTWPERPSANRERVFA